MTHTSSTRAITVSGGRRRRVPWALFGLSHGRRAVLSLAQPGLGAVLATGVLPGPRTLVLGAVAATTGIFCVYASNDLLDRKEDRAAARLALGSAGVRRSSTLQRPLVQDLVSDRVAAWWVLSLGLIALFAAYTLRPGCALIFATCVGLEALYCALKRCTWLKTIAAGLLIGLGGLAGWYAVSDLNPGAAAFVALLAVWEVFGRNVPNDLADLSRDAPLGLRTLATTHGPRTSALASLLGAVAILPIAALQPASGALRLLLVAAAAGSMTIPALRLARRPYSDVAQWYFDRASLFPPLAFVAACALVLIRGAA